MAMLDTIIKIISSKWFVLLIGIAMTFAIPTTWHNVIVVTTWWTVAVFAINLITIFLCSYKFVSMLMGGRKQAPLQQGKW
jgi:hypothetical protein